MKFLKLFILLIIFLLYLPYLAFTKNLSFGDWPYLYQENIVEFKILKYPLIWLEPYYETTAKLSVQIFSFSWELAEKIFWFWPFIIISIFSSYYLTRSMVGVLIYTTNTYVLMLMNGGQLGVSIAYAIAPFVLGLFIRLIKILTQQKNDFFIILLTILALQLMFDPRIVYITLTAVVIYLFICLIINQGVFKLKNLFFYLIIILLVSGINAFWLLPMLMNGMVGLADLGRVYTTVDAVKFFSFADFSHAFSLLHPNWPENIFGKVYFQQPEFILLPVLAYSSLFFVRKLKDQRIIFFALIGLIGAFLAKGTNPPFGNLYLWFFENIPGFVMFRDPTKWYLLVALSYSVLIPYSLSKFSKKDI